jgi:hypothetical protein
MSAPHCCCICSKLVHREKGEREELWRSRKACSLPCRHEMRSRTQFAKAAARLVEAVRTWRPGIAPSGHAQRFGIKGEKFRQALVAAGHTLPVGRARVEKPEPPPKRKKGGPPVDRLLLRLEAVYGARRSASSSIRSPAPARSTSCRQPCL